MGTLGQGRKDGKDDHTCGRGIRAPFGEGWKVIHCDELSYVPQGTAGIGKARTRAPDARDDTVAVLLDQANSDLTIRKVYPHRLKLLLVPRMQVMIQRAGWGQRYGIGER